MSSLWNSMLQCLAILKYFACFKRVRFYLVQILILLFFSFFKYDNCLARLMSARWRHRNWVASTAWRVASTRAPTTSFSSSALCVAPSSGTVWIARRKTIVATVRAHLSLPATGEPPCCCMNSSRPDSHFPSPLCYDLYTMTNLHKSCLVWG